MKTAAYIIAFFSTLFAFDVGFHAVYIGTDLEFALATAIMAPVMVLSLRRNNLTFSGFILAADLLVAGASLLHQYWLVPILMISLLLVTRYHLKTRPVWKSLLADH